MATKKAPAPKKASPKKPAAKKPEAYQEPAPGQPDDGVINGPVDLRPGAVNYVGVSREGKKLIQALDSGNFTASVSTRLDGVYSRFDIRDDVPVPLSTRDRAAVYPLARLAVGQSLLVKPDTDPDVYASEEEYKKARNEDITRDVGRLQGAVRRFLKGKEGYKFVVRKTPEGACVWRVEA